MTIVFPNGVSHDPKVVEVDYQATIPKQQFKVSDISCCPKKTKEIIPMWSAIEALLQCFHDRSLSASLWEESPSSIAGSMATRTIIVDLGEPSVMWAFFSKTEYSYISFAKEVLLIGMR